MLRYLSTRRSASGTSRDGKPPWLTVGTEKIPGCGQEAGTGLSGLTHWHLWLKRSLGAGRISTVVEPCAYLQRLWV